MKRHIRMHWRLFAVVACVALLAYGAAALYPIRHTIPFDEAAYDRLAVWVQHNPASSGKVVVQLPPEFARLSATKRAYLSGKMIFVPSWVGRNTLLGSDETVVGYLFSPTPLPGEEPSAPDLRWINAISVPVFSAPWSAGGSDKAQEIQALVTNRSSQNWYDAQYDTDPLAP